MYHSIVHQSYKVICPADCYSIRKMPMVYIKELNGDLFPGPCNGCDFLSMDTMCGRCTKIITSYFYRNINKDWFRVEEPIDVQELFRRKEYD